MNGEDFCRVLLERSSRPLRPTRPALALALALVRSLACSPARAQAPQPLAENPYDDTMSGVPTTEKCLLPRVVMRCPLLRVREGFPYAVERSGEAATGEVDAEIRCTIIGRTSSFGRRDRLVSSFIGSRRSPPPLGAGRALRVSWHAVGAMPERAGTCLPIVTLAQGCARHCGGRYAQCRAIARLGAAVRFGAALPTTKGRGKIDDGKMFAAHAPKSSPGLSDRRYFSICVGRHASFPNAEIRASSARGSPEFTSLLRYSRTVFFRTERAEVLSFSLVGASVGIRHCVQWC